MQKFFYFFYAIRPQTLIASIAPVLMGSILCYKDNLFSLTIFYFTLFAAILIQMMTNLINDLYDYKKGADKQNRIGPDRMMQKGYLTEKEILFGIYCIFLCALFIGIYLVIKGGVLILFIGLSSFLFAYLYTATRFSIAYNGLGEIFVFLYFGIIACMGTYYLQTLNISFESLLLGSIVGCLNVNLLIINNIRDYLSDKLSKKNKLIVKYGITFGRLEFILMLILSYLFLYIFAVQVNNMMLFYKAIPMLLFIMYIIFKLMSDKSFVNHKALPLFSIYILLFTSLLTYNIFYDI